MKTSQQSHQKHRLVKAKINKRNYKLRSFGTAKETINKAKKQATGLGWEKSFAHYTADRALTARIYKELQNLSDTETNNPVKKRGKEVSRQLSKEPI